MRCSGNRAVIQMRTVPMKKVTLFFAMLSLATLSWGGSAREDATERLENATNVLHEIMGMPDKGIPEEVLEHAKCVAVVPHMVIGCLLYTSDAADERSS